MNKYIVNELLKLTCPFPFVNFDDADSSLNDGFILQLPSICKKKFSKNCIDFYSSIRCSEDLEYHTCPYGFSIFSAMCNSVKIVISGLISFSENRVCSKQFRKLYNPNKIDSEKIRYWFNNFKNIIPSVESEIQNKTKSAIAMLHDIQKTNSLIKSNAETLIRSQKGSSSEDKFENCPESLKSIYKASELLSNQMELVNLFSNPAMITAGRKRPLEVYRFFDKIRLLYSPKSKNKNCRVNLSSFSGSIEAYDSFSLIPLILIDNAIKYSSNNNSIQVLFEESENKDTIKIQVVSVGPLIEEKEKTLIFEMYYKGENSYAYSSEGSGIGLYLAKSIVKGHGGEIYVDSIAKNVLDKDVPLAENTLTLIVSKAIK